MTDQSVDARLRQLEARFETADRRSEYLAIADEARQLVADDHRVHGLRARLLAVDCHYRAAHAGAPADRAMATALPQTLSSDLQATHDLLATAPRDIIYRFVSLTAALAGAATRSSGGDEQQADHWRFLASVIEKSIPADFTFAADVWGNEWVAASLTAARSLAAISLLYGDSSAGEQRLVAALDLSRSDNDVLAYRERAAGIYATLTKCWRRRPVLVVTVAAVQRVILEHIDDFRGTFRSRAGRLFVAQSFEMLVSGFVRHLAEPALPGMDVSAPAVHTLFEFLRERLLRNIESGKSRLLLDQLGWGTRPFEDPALEQTATAAEREFLALPPNRAGDDELVRRETQLASRLPIVFWQDPQLNRPQLRARLATLQRMETMFHQSDAGLDRVEPVVDLDALRDQLSDREAIIEYAIPRDTLHPAPSIYALVITKEGVRGPVVQPLERLKEIPALYRGDIGGLRVGSAEPIEESPLGELVFQARLAIQRDLPEARLWLQLLHMLLIDPLGRIDVMPERFDCWYVVPHGLLHSVPFAALIDADGRFLNSRTALCVTPSASVWSQLRRPWSGIGRFVGFANPALDAARWAPVPHTESEVRTAAALLANLDASVFVQRDATLDMFARTTADASILHLASHGDFPESDVIDFHRVLLTPGASDDGHLTADIVRRLNLRGTRLAVMSVCDGGLNRVGTGDELYGLVPALLQAGAANVLTTLWRVDDVATTLWMRLFYGTVLRQGPARAAQQASQTFIDSDASIRDWASFTLVGGGGGN
jgi:hypothetical protein